MQRQREEYAPPDPQRTTDEALEVLRRAMIRRETERLAIEGIEPEWVSTAEIATAQVLPLAELAEAGAEAAVAQVQSPSETGWRGPRLERMERELGSAREL
jgi:hypothetical protein